MYINVYNVRVLLRTKITFPEKLPFVNRICLFIKNHLTNDKKVEKLVCQKNLLSCQLLNSYIINTELP